MAKVKECGQPRDPQPAPSLRHKHTHQHPHCVIWNGIFIALVGSQSHDWKTAIGIKPRERTWTTWWTMAHFQEEEEDPVLYHLTALHSLEPVGFFSHFQTLFFSNWSLFLSHSNLNPSTIQSNPSPNPYPIIPVPTNSPLYPLRILLQVLLRERQPQWCALVVNTQTLKVLLKVHFW